MIEIVHHEVSLHSPLSVSQMCAAVEVARADYYRQQHIQSEVAADLELRDAIQHIALEMSAYGYRRITHELRRRGVIVNHKRILRLMRKDNLLCLRKKCFIKTTDSRHPFGLYPNLVPTLFITGIDQLWVADITYIRLRREFVYLAVLLNAFSRRLLGWHLDRTLEAELAVTALKMALADRTVQPGLVHHSDRGVQ
jgi:transposase InsO family protein